MAIPSSPCEGSGQTCTSLYDIANHLLTEVFDALLATAEPSCCGEIAAYVTVGQGDDGAQDALTVSIVSITSSPNTRPGGLGLFRGSFDVRLRESGWPTVEVAGEEILLPEPTRQATAAAYLLSRGEAIHRRLSALMTSRGLVPAGVRCSNASIGTLSPLYPQGGVAGWVIPVTVDLPWN